MAVPASPLIQRERSEPFARRAGRVVTTEEFLNDVLRSADALPDGNDLINACEDRYRFLVAFFAVVAAGRTNLLPPGRTPEAFQGVALDYPDARRVTDADVIVNVRAPSAGEMDATVPSIADDAVAAIAFTSGSTGAPQPNFKPWGSLVAGARLHAGRLGLSDAALLVATVPPWHMYGLEWTVLLATRAPVTVYCGEAFYPDDVRRALGTVDARRVLVTTPIHLRAMLRATVDFPPVDLVVCATAPLDRALAEEAERRLSARLLEIYGCSEAGTLAYRLPVEQEAWRPFPGFELSMADGIVSASASFLPQPVALADRIELAADGTFRLLGRLGDLVKVAGKRASLADLNARLLTIPGVEDGVIVESSALASGGGDRLCAFVVAPGLSAETVRRRLAERVDRAFLPRPLRVVDALPRSETGKLSRAALDALLDGER